MRALACLLAAAVTLGVAGMSFAAETFRLRAHVVDVQGKPVEGAEVFAYDSPVTRRPPLFISPKTDPAGSAELVIPIAKYWAVARVRQGEKFGPLGIGARHSGEPAEVEPEAAGVVEKTFTVADIQEVARSRESVRESTSRITGRIVSSAGTPIVKGYVFAEREGEQREIPSYISPWVGSDGSFILYLPPKGTYQVRAAIVFPPTGSGKAVSVTTDGKPEVVIDIRLPTE